MTDYFAIQPEQLPYLLPYFGSIILMAAILGYAWLHRGVNGAAAYGWVMVFQIATTIAYILEISAGSLLAKAFWDDVQWLTTAAIALSSLAFAQTFSERPARCPWRLWPPMLAAPALFLLLLLTNEQTQLVRVNTTVVPGFPFSALIYDFTPLSYLYSFYILGVIAAAIVLLVLRLAQTESVYRGQVITVLIGVTLPTITGLLALADVTLTFQRDMTPLAFALGNIFVAWGLFRYRLFNVAPIAREMVFATIPEAVIVVNMQARIVDANPSAYRLLGYEKRALIGQSLLELPEPWANVVARYEDITGVVNDTLDMENGGRQVFSLSITPIVGDGRAQAGWLIMLRDITESRLAAEALAEQAEELRQAKKKAEQANLAKSQFLATMSHELRTPLNAIINFSEMIRLGMIGPVNQEQAELLDFSLNSSRHLLNLINDVLDISKIQAGKMLLFIEENIDLYTEIETAVATVEPLLQNKPIHIVKDIDDNLPAIAADKRRIRQILLNLLTNAAKFAEEGAITLAAKRRDDHLLFAVMDTGPGIPPELQTTIFEPFSQTANGVKRAEGAGLGLAITLSLVQAHGGRLWLESEPDGGAAFFFTIPIVTPTD